MPKDKEQTLRDLCDKFESFGNKTAILTFGQEDSQKLSFKELLKLVRELATGLSKDGLQHQETVMLLAGNSRELAVAALSVIYAGGICVPVDLQSSDEVLNHIIEDSEAKRIFVDARALERLQKLQKNKHMKIVRLDNENGSDNWSELLSKKIDLDDNLKAGDQAVLFYTSGTTGLPKGVPLTHTNIVFQIEAEKKTNLLRATDKVLLPLPLFHVYPFVDGFLGPISLGLTVIFPKAVTGPEIIRAIKEGKATVLLAVPRLLRALYAGIEGKARSNNIDNTAFDIANLLSNSMNILGINIGKKLFGKVHKRFPTLRLLACGGALLEPDLARKLMALGWQVAVGYGLTETAPLLTFRLPGNRDLKSVGEPVDGVQIRIQRVKDSDKPNDAGNGKNGDKKDESDNESKEKHKAKEKVLEKRKERNKAEPEATDDESENEQPEIQAKGKSVFSGYRNLPEKTKETFTEDGWFKTGDTGYMFFGNLHVTGRISTTLKSEGGKKIQPEEIEKAYEKDGSIREIGILQSKNKLVALVVPNITAIGHGDAHAKIEEVIKKVSESSPSYYKRFCH